MKFANRTAAGQLLATLAEPHRSASPVLLAMPRGGVPVAAEVARALGVPLDVLVARRLWAPGQPELAIGAVAPGVRVLHETLIAEMQLSLGYVDTIATEQDLEVERSTGLYRAGLPPLDLAGETVVLVDDGLASGATAMAALASARQHSPRRLVFATPVASELGLSAIRGCVDDVWCLLEVADFGAVSDWYEDFSAPTESDVVAMLRRQ